MSTLDRIVLSAECWRCLCVTRVPLHQGAPVLVGCMGCGQPWVDAEALAEDYHRARVALEYHGVEQRRPLVGGRVTDSDDHGVEQQRPLVGGRDT
jgi:hypothetical protein